MSFKLSDKILEPKDMFVKSIKEDDVKEFIRLLKEILKRKQIVLMSDIEIAQEIDKLSGDLK